MTTAIEPVGTLWLNALRMTIVPLVVSLVVAGVAALGTSAARGPVGKRLLLVIITILGVAGLFTAVAAPLFLEWFPIDARTAAALRSTLRTAPHAAADVFGFGEWIIGLVPTNPVDAAARGAMLPLIVFSVLLGSAAIRLPPDSRDRLLGVFRSLGDAMMVIVQWILKPAPIGVFALSFPLGAGAGMGVVGALGHYVIMLSLLYLAAMVVLYPLTLAVSGLPMRQFARATAPAQAVAFSTRSSVASLPVMLESAQARLAVPPAISDLVLPLTVSVMRLTSPVAILGAALFSAAACGVVVAPPTIMAAALVAVLTSLSEAGLPGQVGLVASLSPAFLIVGAPLELIGLLLVAETIPDAIATVGNVTADMAVTAYIAHWIARRGDDERTTARVPLNGG